MTVTKKTYNYVRMCTSVYRCVSVADDCQATVWDVKVGAAS